MKGLYLLFHGFAPHNGISKKVHYQVKALNDCGIETSLCYMTVDNDGFQKRIAGEEVINNYGNGVYAKFIKWFSFGNVIKYIKRESVEFVYIRSFNNANPAFLYMLYRLKKSGVQVVMEIPTYPYDNEFSHSPLEHKLRFYINKAFRPFLKYTLKYIVTFSDFDKIHGIDTIKISNGIDFDDVKLKTVHKTNNEIINVTGVAEIHFWHGFDRILYGLADYINTQSNIKVVFHIVGDGVSSEMSKLRAIVKELNLSEQVVFYGNLCGKELDRIFDFTDFGIASLGRHRSGITKIKTLKNREYAARGIPFIYSENDDDFDYMPYVIKASANDTPIDIGKIVAFMGSFKMSPMEIRASIIQTLSWKNQMYRVIKIVFPKL